MQIKVKELLSNPFRNMNKNPINQAKVDILKSSIEQTGFWDNIMARYHPEQKGKYQLAYGHNRLEAIKQLSIVEIDIPVRDLDDATMLQMMANENFQQDKMSPKVINETVSVAKEFLDGELAKYGSWEEVQKDLNKFIQILFDTEHSFIQTKTHGVGHTTIRKFLGVGWKQTQIQHALSTLKDESIDREAVEAFETSTESEDFKKIMKERKIPKEKQLEIATTIAKERKVRKDKKEGAPSGPGATKEQRQRDFHSQIRKAASEFYTKEEIEDHDLIFIELESRIKTLQERIRSTKIAAQRLNSTFIEYQIEEIHPDIIQQFVVADIMETIDELNTVLLKFGITLFPKKAIKELRLLS